MAERGRSKSKRARDFKFDGVKYQLGPETERALKELEVYGFAQLDREDHIEPRGLARFLDLILKQGADDETLAGLLEALRFWAFDIQTRRSHVGSFVDRPKQPPGVNQPKPSPKPPSDEPNGD